MKKIFALIILTFSFSALAFTEEEKTLIRDVVNAEPSISSCVTAGDDGCVANWLNAVSTFVAWRSRVSDTEIYADEGFNFALVDGLSSGKRDEWKDFLFKSGFCNPSKSNIRAGIIDVWSGNAARVAVQDAIFALFKRNATNLEEILATGIGTDADPGILTFEGSIQVGQVGNILRP